MSDTVAASFDPTDGLDESLRCPLCDYDLRGLAEPRCPECGFQFDWEELRERRRTTHPYLFEHFGRDPVRRLLRTLGATERPKRFWRELRPMHPLNVLALVGFWFVVMLLALAILLALVWVSGMISSLTYTYTNLVRQVIEACERGVSVTDAWREASQYWSPSPLSVMWRNRIDLDWSVGVLGVVFACAILWPWLTAATLLIFRSSLRQARIRPAHVLRCTLYASAMLPRAALLTAVLAPVGAIAATTMPFHHLFTLRWGVFRPGEVLLPVAVMMYLASSSLTVAYRQYLTFPQARLTVLMSQVVVGLCFTTVYFVSLQP